MISLSFSLSLSLYVYAIYMLHAKNIFMLFPVDDVLLEGSLYHNFFIPSMITQNQTITNM